MDTRQSSPMAVTESERNINLYDKILKESDLATIRDDSMVTEVGSVDSVVRPQLTGPKNRGKQAVQDPRPDSERTVDVGHRPPFRP